MTTFPFLKWVVQILVVLCSLDACGSELQADDSCRLGSGAEGLCKFLTDCPSAIKAIEKGNFPTKCGFKGTHVIICCESTSPVTKPPKVDQPRIETTTPNITANVTTTKRTTGEISEKKCKEYTTYRIDRTVSPTLVIGGELAVIKEYPHMVLLGYSKGKKVEWNCGGSLISENYVLTAGHCLRHTEVGLTRLIRTGMTNLSDLSHMQERVVIEVIFHPEYNPPSKYNDIALLKLSERVDLNPYARPACLHTAREIFPRFVYATGWGNIGFATGEGSNDLLKVVLEIIAYDTCNQSYRREINKKNTELKDGILDDLMVCAAGPPYKVGDTCQGDSGGPLQIELSFSNPDMGGMYSIVGITSFGKACGLANNTPGVYTRVSSYIKWIEDIVWPEEHRL